MGWNYDGVQTGLEGEPFCHNYTDTRIDRPTTGMTVSVYHEDHTPVAVRKAIEAAESRVK